MGVRRLVAWVVALGVGAQGFALFALGSQGPVVPEIGTSVPTLPLAVACLVATLLSDWLAVPVRHGDTVEELTLFEAACVVDVLVLPAPWALTLPVAATVLCSTLRRRGGLKIAFNGGNLAVGVALLVATTHAVSTPELSSLTVIGVVVGTLLLCAVNLGAFSLVLQAVADIPARDTVRDGARLSGVLALCAVAIGGSVVGLAEVAPAMLPFALVPASALRYAFWAQAREAEHRDRSQRLIELTQMLANPVEPELLDRFLELARGAFSVDVALALLDPTAAPGGASPVTVCDDEQRGLDRRAASLYETELLWRTEGAALLTDELPDRWSGALVAPLEAEGRRLGVVVLASRKSRHGLTSGDAVLLGPLASALGVALRAAVHLQRLEEERSKLKAVVEASSDGILVLNGRGVVQLWSPSMETLTGRSEVAAVGRPIAALLATTSSDGTPLDLFASGRDVMTLEHPHVTVEMVLTRDDGEQRTVRVAHAGVFDGDELARDVVMIHDVTRERRVERLKADFIATVSHELRTPVTPIKGYADLLRRRGHAMTEEKRNECLDVISDRASHLTRLVEDLLLASRISATESSGRGKVDMAQDDLTALVRRACGDFGDQTSRLTLDLPATPVLVACDPVRVIQVLTNLVSNALKYSAPTSPVLVSLRTDGDAAVVEVQDCGRGIPADQVDKVFDKFHRVEDPMLMTTGGTGLGLYIARELAVAMGGTLTCRSTLGVGSEFTLTLRSAAARTAAAEAQASSDAAPGAALPTALLNLPRPRHAPPWAAAPPRPEPADGVIAP